LKVELELAMEVETWMAFRGRRRLLIPCKDGLNVVSLPGTHGCVFIWGTNGAKITSHATTIVAGLN
jgi:hypothetical protein